MSSSEQTNDNATLRQLLQASLAVTHSRHAIGLHHARGTLSQPRTWVEPSQSKEEALLEAHRIAADPDNHFGTAFASLTMGRWYATDQRIGIVDAVIVVEIHGEKVTVTNEGGSAWR